MKKLKSPRFFWVLIDEKKQLIEYVEFPKGVIPKAAKPHRPRWAERQTGKRVRLYLPLDLKYTWIKTFNTKAGRGAKRHWDESAVEIWVETKVKSTEHAVTDRLDEDAYDLAVEKAIVEWLEDEDDLNWILGLGSRTSWKLEKKAAEVSDPHSTSIELTPRYPVGKLQCWRMPNYEEDLMHYAAKKEVDLP